MNKIKQSRIKAELTQAQLADKVNITIRNYQHIEYGRRLPRVDRAVAIAKVLNTTVEELFPITTKLKNNKQLNNTIKGD